MAANEMEPRLEGIELEKVLPARAFPAVGIAVSSTICSSQVVPAAASVDVKPKSNTSVDVEIVAGVPIGRVIAARSASLLDIPAPVDNEKGLPVEIAAEDQVTAPGLDGPATWVSRSSKLKLFVVTGDDAEVGAKDMLAATGAPADRPDPLKLELTARLP
jgi:hypothetical protein